ncbi:MAG: hypothetical protein ABWY27_14905 [Telluria sp.]|jgi:hypothetical protein
MRRLLAALAFIMGGITFELANPVQCNLIAARRTVLRHTKL